MTATDESVFREAQALIKLARSANNPVVSALWAVEAARRYTLLGDEEEASEAYRLAESFAQQVQPECASTSARDSIKVILALEYADRIGLKDKANQLYAHALQLEGILRDMRYVYGPGVAVELKDTSSGQTVILPRYLIEVTDEALSLHSRLVDILSMEEGRQDAERNLNHLVELRNSHV